MFVLWFSSSSSCFIGKNWWHVLYQESVVRNLLYLMLEHLFHWHMFNFPYKSTLSFSWWEEYAFVKCNTSSIRKYALAVVDNISFWKHTLQLLCLKLQIGWRVCDRLAVSWTCTYCSMLLPFDDEQKFYHSMERRETKEQRTVVSGHWWLTWGCPSNRQPMREWLTRPPRPSFRSQTHSKAMFSCLNLGSSKTL